MQATFSPKATLFDLDKICNNILWGESDANKKLHLVAKDLMFIPKENEGLRIVVESMKILLQWPNSDEKFHRRMIPKRRLASSRNHL